MNIVDGMTRQRLASLTSPLTASDFNSSATSASVLIPQKCISEADEVNGGAFECAPEISWASTLLVKHSMRINANTGVRSRSTMLLNTAVEIFGKENELDVIEWMEAWDNYLNFVQHYYTRRCSIARKNIFLKHHCHERPFKHNDTEWLVRLEQVVGVFKDADRDRRINELRPSGPSTRYHLSCDRECGQAPRFTPYDATDLWQHTQSFLTGKSRFVASGSCLICRRSAHYVQDCTAYTTEKGCPVISRFDPCKQGILVGTKDSKDEFCMVFNSGGPTRCPAGLHPTSCPVSSSSDAGKISCTVSLPSSLANVPLKSSYLTFSGWATVLNCIITPYNALAYKCFLDEFCLTNQFPHIVNSLIEDFTLGVPNSQLADSIIPLYRPSDDDIHIDQYLKEEISDGRMDGPYTFEEMEELCGGHFAACPVHVVVMADESRKAKHRVVQNISFEGEASYSVNDLIDSDEFLMELSRIAPYLIAFLDSFHSNNATKYRAPIPSTEHQSRALSIMTEHHEQPMTSTDDNH
ncbi:hypothetical protein EVG20_g11624 [Dentipellis fragilis]|uniref:Uncharacterized protein n=1 Tax=Dentipellis fragilis TaxID=205917 RepID=A0A4Y9XM45_9AGAM|nr:hypothetical protein EVG20_g11624 [Dentipellis fragilis]